MGVGRMHEAEFRIQNHHPQPGLWIPTAALPSCPAATRMTPAESCAAAGLLDSGLWILDSGFWILDSEVLPRRIATLLPSATEIVCALGLGDRIVGVSHECDHPPEIVGRAVLTEPKLDPRGTSAEIDAAVRRLVRDGLSVSYGSSLRPLHFVPRRPLHFVPSHRGGSDRWRPNECVRRSAAGAGALRRSAMSNDRREPVRKSA
jgi:hypothetical protein